jgi:hypothetical protein
MNFAAIIDMHKYLIFSTLRLFAHYKYGMSTRAKSGYQTFSRTEIFSISFWLSREGEEFFDASGGGGHGVYKVMSRVGKTKDAAAPLTMAGLDLLY